MALGPVGRRGSHVVAEALVVGVAVGPIPAFPGHGGFLIAVQPSWWWAVPLHGPHLCCPGGGGISQWPVSWACQDGSGWGSQTQLPCAQPDGELGPRPGLWSRAVGAHLTHARRPSHARPHCSPPASPPGAGSTQRLQPRARPFIQHRCLSRLRLSTCASVSGRGGVPSCKNQNTPLSKPQASPSWL